MVDAGDSNDVIRSFDNEECLREDINRKKTFSFGHCPNYGGGLPMQLDFLDPMHPMFLMLSFPHFWVLGLRKFIVHFSCNHLIMYIKS